MINKNLTTFMLSLCVIGTMCNNEQQLKDRCDKIQMLFPNLSASFSTDSKKIITINNKSITLNKAWLENVTDQEFFCALDNAETYHQVKNKIRNNKKTITLVSGITGVTAMVVSVNLPTGIVVGYLAGKVTNGTLNSSLLKQKNDLKMRLLVQQ